MATSQDVINAAYLQALGRPADPDGLSFYAGQLESGAKSVGDILADLNYAAATGVEDKAANQAVTASGGWDFAPPPPPPAPSGGGGGGSAAPSSPVTPLTAQDLYNQFLGGRPALEKDYKFWNNYIAKYGPDQAMAAFDAAAEQERNMDLAARAASLREQNLVRPGTLTAQDLYNQYLGGRSALQADLDFWNNYITVYGPDKARAAFQESAEPEKKMPVEERVKSLRDQNLTVPGSLLGEFSTQRKATPAEVRSMYLSVLGREPDPEGFSYYTSQPIETLRQNFYQGSIPEMEKRVAAIPVTTAIPKPVIGQVSPQSRGQSVDIPGSFVTTNQGAPKPLTVDISTMPREQQDLTSFIVGKMPRPTTTPGPMFTPGEVNAQLELERLKAMNAPSTTDQGPVAGFAQGGLVGDDINRMLQNQRNAIQRESQSRQMLTNMGAPPVKKFSNGGPAGSSSGVRRLEMSGYQEGGEVTDEMFVGTRPEDFPETSVVDKKAGELLRALSEGTRGFVGAEPIEAGSEAYRTGQALANMPAVGVVAATAKGAGKAKDALKALTKKDIKLIASELETSRGQLAELAKKYPQLRDASVADIEALTKGEPFTAFRGISLLPGRELRKESTPSMTVDPSVALGMLKDAPVMITKEGFITATPVLRQYPGMKASETQVYVPSLIEQITERQPGALEMKIPTRSGEKMTVADVFKEVKGEKELLADVSKKEPRDILFDRYQGGVGDRYLMEVARRVLAGKWDGGEALLKEIGGYQTDPKGLVQEFDSFAELVKESALKKAEGGEVTNDEFIQQMMTGTPMSDTSTQPGILPPEIRQAVDVPLDFANLLIRGTAAVPIGGAAGLYKGITGGKYGTQEGVKEADTEAARMMAKITGEPKTQTAKDVLQFVGDKMQEYKLDAALPQLLTLPSPGAGTTEFIKQAVRSEFEAPPVGAVTLKPDASTDLGIKKLEGGLIFPADETSERLRLKMQRKQLLEEKGKAMPGAPKNARTVIKAPKDSGLPDFVVGDIRPQDWIARTENLLKPDEIQQYGRWYDDVRGTFLKYTDGDEKLTDKYMRAWLVANQNIGVEGAFNNVLLQAEQFARKIPPDQMRAGGLPFATQAARNALQDQPITEGVGLKIADFVDSAEGKGTRSIYGNDQQAGAPFVVDIHTARDTGLVDDVLLNHLERSGYKVDRSKVKTDLSTGPTDTQYENRADFGRNLTQHLNENKWQGRDDWTPKEVQAIGWMAMTKLTRDAADDTVTALERSLRRLSMEFSPGEGSPWATRFGERFNTLDPEGQRELTQVATSRAVEMAKQVSGIDLRNVVHGSGGWQKFQNPATVAQALATKEGSEIAANALGYLLNQTEVWSNAVKGMTKNPKAFAIDFVQKKGDDLSTDQGIMGFWEKVMEVDPTGLFVGYHPFTTVDNQPGIRVIVDKGGAKRMQDIQAALEGPIAKMIKDSPLDIDARGYENELVKAINNWKENPDGQLYLARLADLGVGSPATRLDPLRGELETAIESWFENRAGAAKPGAGKRAAPTTSEAPAAEGVKRRRGKGTTSAAEDLAALEDIVKKAQDKNIDLQAAETDSVIDIGLIKVPKRGKGLGTEAMQELTEYADRTGKPIRLVPDPNIARNIDPERLVSFYERLGFVKQEPQVGQAESGSTFRQFAPTYWVYTPKIKKAKGGEVSITDFIKRAA